MSDWQPVALADAPVPVVPLLTHTGLATSKNDARRLITQGGAYLNNTRVTPGQVLTPADLLHGRIVILRRGKRDIAAVEVLRAGEHPDSAVASCVLMPVPEETRP